MRKLPFSMLKNQKDFGDDDHVDHKTIYFQVVLAADQIPIELL